MTMVCTGRQVVVVEVRDAAAAARSARRRRRSTACDARPPSATCLLPATASCSTSVQPRRRYHGSLVMNPMWQNCVEASIGRARAPGVETADVDRGDGRELPVGEHGTLRLAGRARREDDGRGARRRRACSGDGASFVARSNGKSSPMMRSGASWSRTCCFSLGARRGLMPDVTAPSFASARYAATYRGSDGSVSATTLPSRTACCCASETASSSDQRSSSRIRDRPRRRRRSTRRGRRSVVRRR